MTRIDIYLGTPLDLLWEAQGVSPHKSAQVADGRNALGWRTGAREESVSRRPAEGGELADGGKEGAGVGEEG